MGGRMVCAPPENKTRTRIMTSSSTVADEQVPPKPAAATGLSSAEAEARLDQYGPNDPAPVKRGAAVVELLLSCS